MLTEPLSEGSANFCCDTEMMCMMRHMRPTLALGTVGSKQQKNKTKTHRHRQ